MDNLKYTPILNNWSDFDWAMGLIPGAGTIWGVINVTKNLSTEKKTSEISKETFCGLSYDTWKNLAQIFFIPAVVCGIIKLIDNIYRSLDLDLIQIRLEMLKGNYYEALNICFTSISNDAYKNYSIEELVKLIRLHENNPEFLEKLGDVYSILGNEWDADDYYTSAISKYGNNTIKVFQVYKKNFLQLQENNRNYADILKNYKKECLLDAVDPVVPKLITYYMDTKKWSAIFLIQFLKKCNTDFEILYPIADYCINNQNENNGMNRKKWAMECCLEAMKFCKMDTELHHGLFKKAVLAGFVK